MQFAMFLVGMISIVVSIIFNIINNDFLATAVNDSTATVLSLVFPLFLIGGLIFIFLGVLLK